MPSRIVIATLVLFVPAHVWAQFDYDRHVAFDNSPTSSYHYSEGSVVAPSDLELADGRFPVEEATCHTPPNCLRLRWRSETGGDWRLTIRLTRHYTTARFSGSTLSFWIYSDTDLPAEGSPLVQVTDTSGESSPTTRLIGSALTVPAKQWVRISLRFTIFTNLFKSTSDAAFDPDRLASITILQGLDEGKPRTLFIDDIWVTDDSSDAGGQPLHPPSGLSARGYDRHVDLSWTASPDTRIQHVTIYRSLDGHTFVPIGIQKGHVRRYVDFLGASGRTASYRITAVDRRFNESAPSATCPRRPAP